MNVLRNVSDERYCQGSILWSVQDELSVQVCDRSVVRFLVDHVSSDDRHSCFVDHFTGDFSFLRHFIGQQDDLIILYPVTARRKQLI